MPLNFEHSGCFLQIFKNLREIQPKFHEKLLVVHGDVNDEDFGLHEENLKKILEETSLVFHVAATVRFDEPLK
jgi:alcohol-forming fatty acyl-CoA reductase